MSIPDIKQHLLRTFAKLVKGTDVIARMETNIYFVRDAEWFENQLKRFIIPYGVSTITLKQLFVEQFKNFTVYDEVAPVSDLPNIFNTFRMRDPTVYLNNEVKTMIDFLKTTYADEVAFYFNLGRDQWRFRNNYKRTKISLGCYGERGGEGKGFLTSLRTKVYGNEFSSVNVRFSQLGKEQTKSLLENKLQIQFDELPRIKDGKVVVEDFKILDNDMLSTRSMARDDENITLYFDCDFSTNNSSFAGIYSDEAVQRRLYPIERILSTREDAVEMWKQLWSWINNEDFIFSYVKYIRESEDIEKNTTIKPYSRFTMLVFFNRIHQSYEYSFDIWLEEFTEEQYNKNLSYERKADGIKGFNAIDLYKNYTQYCSLNKLPSTMNKIGTFNERLKRIFDYDINTIMCTDGVKRRLIYIIIKEDENINQ